jgi:pyruvate, water dikinase
MAARDLIRPITGVGLTDRPVVGGKGASLGELCRAGLPVPAGFVVTAQAFERALHAADPAGEFGREIGRLSGSDNDAIARVTAEIRGRIAAAPVPDDVRRAVASSYRGLATADAAGADPAVAVRSSATSEDTATASFAGLQDTYLWVRGGEALLDHVRRCWASLYNAEAVSYRLRQGIAEHGQAMGVVVQLMVDPRSAGVMFTCSPTTGDRSVVAIEGSWGLGSVLVSGEVTPDSFVVSKVTGEIVRRTVSRKLRQHIPDPAGSGTVAAEVPEPLRDRPCLDDDQIRALARIGQQVERHYGAPQDIEWAVTGPAAGAGVVLLQSRPETVWSGRVSAPVAVPRPRAVDHVFEQLGRVVQVPRPER